MMRARGSVYPHGLGGFAIVASHLVDLRPGYTNMAFLSLPDRT